MLKYILCKLKNTKIKYVQGSITKKKKIVKPVTISMYNAKHIVNILRYKNDQQTSKPVGYIIPYTVEKNSVL